MRKFFKHRLLFILFFVFVGSIVFRMWFIAGAPQPYGWDQWEYDTFAYKMLHHPFFLASHSYRSYPFPLLLAIIYKIVGTTNHQAVFYVNAILDSLTGMMIFAVLRYGFKLRQPAWIALTLYMINPFTSGYVGVVLSEVLSAFFITATIFFGMLFVRKPSLLWGFLFGFSAGMAAETRNAAFFWAAIPIALTFLWIPLMRKNIAKISLVFVGVILTVCFPLYTNWRDYKEINITTVDSFYAKEFFQGVLLKKLPPFTYVYPIESGLMWQEYYSEYDPGRTTEGRKTMANKYYQKAWTLIRKDPWDYVKLRFFKMWYMWQKENVFFYQEPGFANHWIYTYVLNLTILGLTLFGLITGWPLVKHNKVGKWIYLSIVGSILYATGAFSLTHAEYRLTIPFYPLLFTSSGIGVYSMLRLFL